VDSFFLGPTFSQRMGKTRMQKKMQKNTMTDSFWNRLLSLVSKDIVQACGPEGYLKAKFEEAYRMQFGTTEFDVKSQLAKGGKDAVIFLYNFVEFLARFAIWRVAQYPGVADYAAPNRLISKYNAVFEAEKSAYRFADNFKLIPIVDQTELDAINDAQKVAEPYRVVYESLEKAREYFSDISSPDYETTIHHSINAIETVCRIILKDDKATLGEAIDQIEGLHKSFKQSIKNLHGFASDAPNIRHGGKSDSQVTVGEHEARFVLVTSHSIVNYLISKYLVAN